MNVMSRWIQVMVVAALWGAPQVALGQAGEPVVMLFAGDLMLSGHVDGVARGDTTYVFRYWKPGAEADIFMANLEEPITVHDRKVEKEFNFKMDPQFVGTLRDGRLTLVTVANNHVADYGREGLLETIGHLERAGIPFVGIGTSLDQARSPVVLSVKGKRIGFLGYFGGGEYAATDSSGGFAPRSERMIIEDVRRADSTVDYLVVNFHWGTERAESPERWQVSLAHEVVRAGADLVVGHHPHVLQGAERYQSGIIAYSLGNFVFGGNSRQNYDTAVLKVVLDDRGPSAEIIPVSVRGYQPRPATGSARESVLSLVSQRSTLFQHPLVVHTGGSP
jgi:poly-gamma-glutamate capsule biosynthesis protein CapA/YwtB (metallophosphatase superfamily)